MTPTELAAHQAAQLRDARQSAGTGQAAAELSGAVVDPGAPATHHRAWTPELGAVQLPQPPGTNVETNTLVKALCIDGTTIGTERLNNTIRVMDYFVADISTLRGPL